MAVAAAAALLQIGDLGWISFVSAALPAIPKSILEDVERFVAGQIELQPASWLLVGLALARIAAGGPPSSSRLQDAADRLERSPWWVYAAFHDACVDNVRGLNEPAKEEWLQELERPVFVADKPSPVTGRVRVSPTPSKWGLDDVFDLWGHEVMAIEVVGSHAPTTLLRALDFDRWFRAVDRWDDGRLVGGALFGDHLLHSRAALLRLLKVASDVFGSGR